MKHTRGWIGIACLTAGITIWIVYGALGPGPLITGFGIALTSNGFRK